MDRLLATTTPIDRLAGIIRKAQQKKMIRSDFKAEHIADIFAAILSTVIVGLLKEKPSCFEDPKNISGFRQFSDFLMGFPKFCDFSRIFSGFNRFFMIFVTSL